MTTQIESFSTTPLQTVIPSYLYQQYADDQDLQAFVATQNSLAQGYLDWFNNTSLGLYTSPNISGALLDWIGNGLYGITRPVLSNETQLTIAGYDAFPNNYIAYNTLFHSLTGTASLANDDIYKRVMTWNLYKGDGQVFTMQWLKNHISRFLNGVNGTDYPVLNDQPSISVSGNIFTVSYFDSTIYQPLQLCYNNGSLSFPFQYQLNFVSITFINDGDVLQMTGPLDYPTSSTGLAAGDIWYNGGTVGVIPGITPDPLAPPIYFTLVTAEELLFIGGGNLPLTDPHHINQLWNNGGLICISAG